jgi:hypothetical protein
MIVSKELFLDLGGFDRALKTGEDYEFCARALRSGCAVESNAGLVVIHEDFPRGLLSFMRRESWHGRSDFESPAAFCNSKVAIATAIFLFLHGLMFFGGLLAQVALPLVLLLLAASSYAKYSHSGVTALIVNAFIFYFYFWGRAGALLRVILTRLVKS